MTRSYSVNVDQARASEQIGTRITEPGKYVGIITQAVAVSGQSPSLSQGIAFTFRSDGGQTAEFRIWDIGKDGKENSRGANVINALMLCTKTKELTPQQGEAEVWDNGVRGKKTTTVFPQIHGKRVGALMNKIVQMRNGKEVFDMDLMIPFDAETGRTPSEIADKKPTGSELARFEAMCKTVDSRNKSGASNSRPADGPAPTPPDAEDIPW